MKYLMYILFLVAASCYAGDSIGDTYFDDNHQKHQILNDREGRYYMQGGERCPIDGISGSETTYWDGMGYFDAVRQCYVNSLTNPTVIVNITVYSNGYDACEGGVGYISNGGFPYFNNYRAVAAPVVQRAGRHNIAPRGGGRHFSAPNRAPIGRSGFSRPIGLGSHNSSGGHNFSVDRGRSVGHSSRR